MRGGEFFHSSPYEDNDFEVSGNADKIEGSELKNNDDYEDLSTKEILAQIIAARDARRAPANPKILYPEVFNAEYAEDISPECRSVVESFDKADWYDLFDAYKINFKNGNTKLVGYLTKLLGLKERPKIVYEEKTDGVAGQYRTDSNTIAFFCGPDVYNDTPENFIRIISHEMWHAYQEQRSFDNDNLRSELYDANSRHYIRYKEDPDGYYTQLLEREAMWFGNHMKYAAGRTASEGEDVITKFKRLISFDRRHTIKE